MCRMLSSEGISRLVLGSGTGFQRACYRASAEVHKAKQQLSTLFVCLYLVVFFLNGVLSSSAVWPVI